MSYYKDPTAWEAIANVEREQKRRPRQKQKKHSGVAHYKTPENKGGVRVHVNKAEWFYSQMRREIGESTIQERQFKTQDEGAVQSDGRAVRDMQGQAGCDTL